MPMTSIAPVTDDRPLTNTRDDTTEFCLGYTTYVELRPPATVGCVAGYFEKAVPNKAVFEGTYYCSDCGYTERTTFCGECGDSHYADYEYAGVYCVSCKSAEGNKLTMRLL